MFARSDFPQAFTYSVRFASLDSLLRYVFARVIAIANQTQSVKSDTLAPAKNPATFQTLNFYHAQDNTHKNIFSIKRAKTLQLAIF